MQMVIDHSPWRTVTSDRLLTQNNWGILLAVEGTGYREPDRSRYYNVRVPTHSSHQSHIFLIEASEEKPQSASEYLGLTQNDAVDSKRCDFH